MKKDHFTSEATQTPGFTLDYKFTILSEMFTQNSYIKMMGWILGIIAFVLLFIRDELSAYHRRKSRDSFS